MQTQEKRKKHQINNLNLYLKQLKKKNRKEKNKILKAKRRNEIIKIRA